MKRRKLVNYLAEFGCYCAREGSDHSIFVNLPLRAKTTVPRHSEIDDILAEKICKDLHVPKIKKGK